MSADREWQVTIVLSADDQRRLLDVERDCRDQMDPPCTPQPAELVQALFLMGLRLEAEDKGFEQLQGDLYELDRRTKRRHRADA